MYRHSTYEVNLLPFRNLISEQRSERLRGMLEYKCADGIATITLDDGKVNVLSLDTQRALHEAFDRAEQDKAVVLLSGRPGVFSAGFDLPVLRAGGPAGTAMVHGGFQLAARVLMHPAPVVAACTGHAIAMGAFLLLSCDYRVGAAGPYKLMANEVALGLAFPYTGATILRSRLTPSAYRRATLLSEQFSPDNAIETGFLDRVVPADEVHAAALDVARAATALDPTVFARSRERLCRSLVDDLHRSIEADLAAGLGRGEA
jgi:enoyl-CoA hydratase